MSTSTALDPGYVLWSVPEPERADRPLIVLMHGWSYDERHLFGFAHLFPRQMVVASVRAPYAEAGGYAWFPSRGNLIGDPQPRVANDATEAVLAWATWYLATSLPRPGGPREADSIHPAADLAEIVRIYGIRHWAGQSYKQVKDELGWAGFQVRSGIAIRRHQVHPSWLTG